MVDTLTHSLSEFTTRLGPQIETALDRATQLDPGCPPRLREAMRYSLLAPGKRLRPMLVLMAAEACGGTIKAAMPAACAVEMVHAYSLIHDDLPAMDDDDLRRGRPTCHKVYGEGMAILAGDALLTLAFEMLARGVHPPVVAASCCAALAEAAGPCNLVGGQADDILAEELQNRLVDGEPEPVGIELIEPGATEAPANGTAGPEMAHLQSIHERKTGAMIRVSLRLGGMTAGASDAQISALDAYGYRLGLAFQITDDLLDVRSHEEAMGKRVGKDAEKGKITFPGLLGVDRSAAYAAKLISEACEALEPLSRRVVDGLKTLARYVLERNR